jgi:hypothetical protein
MGYYHVILDLPEKEKERDGGRVRMALCKATIKEQ